MSDHEHDERYISVQAAQQVLRVSARSAQRYAQSGRVSATCRQLLGSINRQPSTHVVPADVLLGYVEKLRQETNQLNGIIRPGAGTATQPAGAGSIEGGAGRARQPGAVCRRT